MNIIKFILIVSYGILQGFIGCDTYNIIPKKPFIGLIRYKRNFIKNDLLFLNKIIENSYGYDNNKFKKNVKNTVIFDNNVKNISSITLDNISINITSIKNIRIYTKNEIINIHLDNNNINYDKNGQIDIVNQDMLLNTILFLYKIYTTAT